MCHWKLENLLTAGPAGHLLQEMNAVYMGRGSNFGTPKKINKLGLYRRKIIGKYGEIWENTLYMGELSHYLVTNVGKTMPYIYIYIYSDDWGMVQMALFYPHYSKWPITNGNPDLPAWSLKKNCRLPGHVSSCVVHRDLRCTILGVLVVGWPWGSFSYVICAMAKTWNKWFVVIHPK